MTDRVIQFPFGANGEYESVDNPVDNPKLLQAARELHHWQYGGGTCFTSKLYDLYAKADARNRARLMNGFPDEGIVFTMWQNCETPNIFFDMFGIKI